MKLLNSLRTVIFLATIISVVAISSTPPSWSAESKIGVPKICADNSSCSIYFSKGNYEFVLWFSTLLLIDELYPHKPDPKNLGTYWSDDKSNPYNDFVVFTVYDTSANWTQPSVLSEKTRNEIVNIGDKLSPLNPWIVKNCVLKIIGTQGLKNRRTISNSAAITRTEQVWDALSKGGLKTGKGEPYFSTYPISGNFPRHMVNVFFFCSQKEDEK